MPEKNVDYAPIEPVDSWLSRSTINTFKAGKGIYERVATKYRLCSSSQLPFYLGARKRGINSKFMVVKGKDGLRVGEKKGKLFSIRGNF
ncbi:hypothetical protein CDAR_58981 [Caerostris darwini]|uniref:NUMOD4 domain-containing protein n=1 Tax=Caerostris darwini TaxID=1538125 RepID=A0AAV4X3U4_9ARAC|nr:hypothetical protein CDAR_58981 [Caerostris darwini]